MAGWESMTFRGAERETLIAGSRLTLAQRLEWIEQATAVARHLERQRQLNGISPAPVTPGVSSPGERAKQS